MADLSQKIKYLEQTIANIRQCYNSKEVRLRIIKQKGDCYLWTQYNPALLSKTQISQFANSLEQGAFDIAFKKFEYSINGFHDQNTNVIKVIFFEEASLTHKCVVISYPGEHYFSDARPDDVIRKQMKTFKSSPTGSGMGFGPAMDRDLSFLVPNAEVKSMQQNIKSMVNQNLKTSINLKVSVYSGL